MKAMLYATPVQAVEDEVRGLMSVFNPLESLLPMGVGALVDSNPWRGAIVGLAVDRLFCLGYYWLLKLPYPWEPGVEPPKWLPLGMLVDCAVVAGIAYLLRGGS